ncbi:type II toxin-antitoxin system VapC family toxin [Candidatus Roizmanbacteria bacterium]|nr:type II toxin-antitoxin system VapC family toxin [Candidatus Roizmanbacteria bacterium]
MLLDSNIVVYAINSASPKHSVAQKFINQYRQSLFLAHQNVLETIRIITHRKFPNPMTITSALKTLSNFTETLSLISPKQESYFLATELIKKYSLDADKVFDAYLVATALSNGITTIATDNEKDFKVIKEISVTDPFSPVN